MHPRIVSLPELKLVAIKVVGRPSELSHRVPLAWLDLTNRLDQIPHKLDPALFYGVFPESDHLNDGVNGVHTYWVGTAVSAYDELPDGMGALTLPAQTNAVATVAGDRTEIQSTYLGLFRWLKEQNRPTQADGFGFELYDSARQSVVPPYERFDYDIYKPLA
jgi:predicted transcriptional regulator YdeE